jgi:hypothetical protein
MGKQTVAKAAVRSQKRNNLAQHWEQCAVEGKFCHTGFERAHPKKARMTVTDSIMDTKCNRQCAALGMCRSLLMPSHRGHPNSKSNCASLLRHSVLYCSVLLCNTTCRVGTQSYPAIQYANTSHRTQMYGVKQTATPAHAAVRCAGRAVLDQLDWATGSML